jgi:aerobic-type carbon monoxide dehydrogenase small subunit (CoxS/CutS family)
MWLLHAGDACRRTGFAAAGKPGRERIREHLSGNYCRCTGYQAIIDAVETTARARVGRKP